MGQYTPVLTNRLNENSRKSILLTSFALNFADLKYAMENIPADAYPKQTLRTTTVISPDMLPRHFLHAPISITRDITGKEPASAPKQKHWPHWKELSPPMNTA
jgi:hypothetical protein